MLSVSIPGFGNLNLNYALVDFNGTLAVDGKLIAGLAAPLNALANLLELHVITGDGCGTAKVELANINCHLTITPPDHQGKTKQQYLHQLNADKTVAIGNGRNDCYILKEAALGIAILGEEGVSGEALLSANIIMPSIFLALELFHYPNRLRATLRF
ncbi:MAG: ATPase P [bacterium]|nr:ATPase P [bacterium]